MGKRAWKHNRRDKRSESLEFAHPEPEVIVTLSGERIQTRAPWVLPKQPEPLVSGGSFEALADLSGAKRE